MAPERHRRHRCCWRLSLLFFLLLSLTREEAAWAVDRSKFRTCQQTSFCRRHRQGASQQLYRYKLLIDSVHFHAPTSVIVKDNKEDSSSNNKDVTEAKKSVWQSLSRRLLGDGGSSTREDAASKVDPYVRGPLPILTGTLENTASPTSSGAVEHLQFSLLPLEGGALRVRITESYGQKKTAYEHARVTYDDLILEHPHETWQTAAHALWLKPNNEQLVAILHTLHVGGGGAAAANSSNFMALQYGSTDDNDAQQMLLVLVQLEPFSIALYRESDLSMGPIVRLGDAMHFEVRRYKDGTTTPKVETTEKETPPEAADKDEAPQQQEKEEEEKEIVGYWEDGLAIYADGTREERKEIKEEERHRQLLSEEQQQSELDTQGMWQESFGSHEDSKPFGPMSVGMDIIFPKSQHLYGLPEHAASAVLQTTVGENAHFKDPYRLYNLDVFEYELDETMALYGGIPVIMSQSVETGTAGVFWFNPTETFVDVEQSDDSSTKTSWISESGVLDVFLLPGPDPASIYAQYARLTGTTPVPPMFALGYHQCRWNYKDEKDVYQVHGKFEELDYPYDVLWLDIEHTDGKRYFTWDDNNFPNPKEMQGKLEAQGRRMVTIVDPHIKRDDGYYIHREATAKGLYIKDKEGKKDYDGWCWPGSSSYLDFTDANVRHWWAEQFGFDRYKGSTPSLFTWNDMNEPSVFNGPEVSMQKDLKNLRGDEHREWHNLYGLLFHRATAEGQIHRSPSQDTRPFVLSRSFFAGSQKHGAIWTGDNTAEWGHYVISAPMLLSMNSAALTFVGADVGGFFGNPDAELFTRWYQAAAYQPFFRGHAHHDSKRREPWMYDADTLVRLRRVAMARYALLPFWYTVFHESSTTGMPVMRMMWMQYPRTKSLFGLDDQYLVGADLLVKPVTKPEATEVEVLFPTDDNWYDAESLALVSASQAPKGIAAKTVPADIDTVPVFQRGGSILPRKLRLRRSTMTMKTDPYTLYIALDKDKVAHGRMYMDDEETFGHEKRSEFANANFSANLATPLGTIQNVVTVGSGWKSQVAFLSAERMIERLIIMGISKAPKSFKLGSKELDFTYNAESQVVVVRKPDVSALKNWEISFTP